MQPNLLPFEEGTQSFLCRLKRLIECYRGMYLAHSLLDRLEEEWHPLADHLEATAARAEKTAGAWGKAAGLLHDLGKYSAEFQARVRGSTERVDHATAGAQVAVAEYGPMGKLLAYAITGHHGGMPNGVKRADRTDTGRPPLTERLAARVPDCSSWASEIVLPASLPAPLLAFHPTEGRNRVGFALSHQARFTPMIPALAYLRTSSAANVRADKDSETRQREAISAFAKRSRHDVVEWFYDPAVKGSDPIDTRPGFKALLDRIVRNGIRTVIVEDASRFARHLLTQEAGIALLVGLGVRVVTSSGDDLTDSDDEFRVAMRQIMGVFSQLEKTRLVKKLSAARARKRASGGYAGGQKPHAKLRPEVVALAKKLKRGRSLRSISAALAEAGHVNVNGRPYAAQSVKAMLKAR